MSVFLTARKFRLKSQSAMVAITYWEQLDLKGDTGDLKEIKQILMKRSMYRSNEGHLADLVLMLVF